MTTNLQAPEADARLGPSRLAATADLIEPRLPSHDAASAREHDAEEALIAGPMHRTTDRRGDGAIGLGGARLVDGVRLHAPVVSRRIEDPQFAGPELPLEPQQLDQVSALFKLLSDKTRLAILQILCEGEMNVTTLCRRLKLPQPTVSHHLGLLRMSRLIANRRSGKQVYYRLHDRVESAALPQRSDSTVDLEAAAELGVRPAGLQIVDTGFSIQILTPATRSDSIYPRLDGRS